MWRFGLIAIALTPLLLWAARLGLPLRWYWLHILLGFTGMFCCLAFALKSIDLGVPAGTAALIGALQPLATAVLAGPVLREAVTLRQWLGLAIGLGGVALAVGQVSGADVLGYAFSLASTLCLVVTTLIAKARWDNSHFLPAFAVQTATAALCVAPLAWWDQALLPAWDLDFVAAVAWAIVFSTGGAYGLYYLCLQRTSAVRVGSLIYLTPPVTMVWAWLMFGQPLTLFAIAGFVICIVGVWLAQARP